MGSNSVGRVEDLSELDKRKLKKIVEEMSNSIAREQAEKLYRKEAATAVSKDMNIDKKLIVKMAKVLHDSNIAEVSESYRRFVYAYKALMGSIDEKETDQNAN